MGVRSDQGRPRHILVEIVDGGPLTRPQLQRLLRTHAPERGAPASVTVVAPTHFLVRTTHWEVDAVRKLLEGSHELGQATVVLRTVKTSGTIKSLRPLLPEGFRTRKRPRKKRGKRAAGDDQN